MSKHFIVFRTKQVHITNEKSQPDVQIIGEWKYRFGLANDGTIDMARITKICDEVLDQMQEGNKESFSRTDIVFLLSFLPAWASNAPVKGQDPTMYGTGSYSGDLEAYRRVSEIRRRLERIV